MIYFFDTSALIKRYIDEPGSDVVDEIFEIAVHIYVSQVTLIEAIATLRRLLHEKILNQEQFHYLKNEFITDMAYFIVVPFDQSVVNVCLDILNEQQLKTLDTIQLASAFVVKSKTDAMVLADQKLGIEAKNLNISTINVLTI